MQEINLDHFIELDLPFFEPRNDRRGGWSGVSRVEWSGEVYFIKRQVSHTYREVRRFFRHTPTLRREVRNTHRLNKVDIGCPEIVIYAEEGANAMMVTKELTGYIDLDRFLPAATSEDRKIMLTSLLDKTIRMHQNGYKHGCLYGKHIMVDEQNLSNVALIDLEKMKYIPRKKSNAVRDISSLFRHTEGWSEADLNQIKDGYETVFPGFTSELNQKLALKTSS